MPNQRLKIDFRSKISVSENFALWLDKMTAPVFEERYHSATEALQVLQKKRPITANFDLKKVYHRPPKGSAIILNWSDTELNLKIPSGGWNKETFNILISTIVENIFSLGITFLLFFIWRLFSSCEITINRDLFIFSRKIFNLEFKKMGQTINIHKISVMNDANYQISSSLKLRGKLTSSCTIEYLGDVYSCYKFGHGLTSVEQDWLVNEIRDFVIQIRLKSNNSL